MSGRYRLIWGGRVAAPRWCSYAFGKSTASIT